MVLSLTEQAEQILSPFTFFFALIKLSLFGFQYFSSHAINNFVTLLNNPNDIVWLRKI